MERPDPWILSSWCWWSGQTPYRYDILIMWLSCDCIVNCTLIVVSRLFQSRSPEGHQLVMAHQQRDLAHRIAQPHYLDYDIIWFIKFNMSYAVENWYHLWSNWPFELYLWRMHWTLPIPHSSGALQFTAIKSIAATLVTMLRNDWTCKRHVWD